MRLLLPLIIAMLSFSIFIQAAEQNKPQKIGLALSGGGAKGSAHIGVLRVLEKNNVKIDYIAGTSIGAYVSGLYALGYDVDTIELIMMNLDWDKGYTDTVPRKELHYEEKQLRDQYNIPIRLGYEKNSIKTASGFLLGQSMSLLMRESTGLVSTFESFDQLAIPYRAIATDLETGNAVVIDKGSIVKAMSASATVPGALTPVIINDKVLVDGGISNNMPVDVLKEMGADIVIAVDIGSSLATKENLQGTVGVLDQLSTILTSSTTDKQKALMTPADILVRPDVGHVSVTDWSVLPIALKLGEEAALEHEKRFRELAVSNSEYARYQADKNAISSQWFNPINQPTTQITYQNESKVSLQIIENSFELREGEIIDNQTLTQAIKRVYALDKFQQVSAEFNDHEDGRELILDMEAKSWGPNYLKFGFSLQDSFTENTSLLIDFAYLATDVNSYGASWKNEVTIGYEKRFATEFYQPMGDSGLFYSRSSIEWQRLKWAGSHQSYLNNTLTKEYYEARSGLGMNIFSQAIIGAGIIGELGDLNLLNSDFSDADFNSYGVYLNFGFDNLDSINFPTSGNRVRLQVIYREDEFDTFESGLDIKDNSIQYTGDWRGAFHIDNHTFVGMGSFSTVNNETSDYTVHFTELGGFLNLSAYQKDELVGAHKVFAGIVYHYDLGHDVFGLSDFPVYLGTSIESGNVWVLKENMSATDLITAGSLFIGTDTSMGPLAVGAGYAENGDSTIFLSIGKSW